jgi:acetyl esterase/lipase
VYAHGGGVVGASAHSHSRFLAYMALDCGVVVFNVDYRLAPETRCPNNALDFYEAIKYVSSNAAELGVDPGRIAMAGESGGGYICAAAMLLLAQRGEAGLVKLAIPVIPMVDDYEFTSKESMLKEEAEGAISMQRTWMCIGGPEFESMRTDPLLFPAKASAELLAKMPPTIVWEAEFDMFLTPASRCLRLSPTD